MSINGLNFNPGFQTASLNSLQSPIQASVQNLNPPQADPLSALSSLFSGANSNSAGGLQDNIFQIISTFMGLLMQIFGGGGGLNPQSLLANSDPSVDPNNQDPNSDPSLDPNSQNVNNDITDNTLPQDDSQQPPPPPPPGGQHGPRGAHRHHHHGQQDVNNGGNGCNGNNDANADTNTAPPYETPTPTPSYDTPTPTPTPTPTYETPTPTPTPTPTYETPTPTPTPTPTYTPPTYDGGDNGQYQGDPHLVGFDGEKYDVMGEDGKTYNMLSDKDIQYNTTFAKYHSNIPGATVIDKAGIQVGKDQVYFDRSGSAPTVNGKPMEPGQEIQLDKGGKAKWDGETLTVGTSEYTIDLKVGQKDDPNGAALESHVTLADGGPFKDMVAPHGLLGQTADGIAGKKDTGNDLGKQGGTVIDGSVGDYEEADLWSHSDKFSRFGVEVDDTKTQADDQGNVIKTFDQNGNVLFQKGDNKESHKTAVAS